MTAQTHEDAQDGPNAPTVGDCSTVAEGGPQIIEQETVR